MPQTKEGAQKARLTMIEKYGEDFYRNIGKAGGKASNTGGFYYAKKNLAKDDPRHPVNAGIKGGTISRRGKAKSKKIEVKQDKKSIFRRLFA